MTQVKHWTICFIHWASVSTDVWYVFTLTWSFRVTFNFKSLLFDLSKWSSVIYLLPTAREGNVFRSVCQSFCSQGGGFPACITGHMTGGIHPGEICIQEGVCIQGGLHPAEGVYIQGRGSASRGGVYIQVRGSASRSGSLHLGEGSASRGSTSRGVCIWEVVQTPPPLIMTSSGSHCSSQHASYWNAFSFIHDSSRSRGLRGSCPPPSCKNKSWKRWPPKVAA